jgi:glucose-6-phosphate 1-dehydrogenase
MEIETPRWTGVPFYLRAGKRLAKRVTEVVIQFKPPAHQLFSGALAGPCRGIPANLIRLRIQPDEGIKIVFGNKLPIPTTAICPVEASWALYTPLLQQWAAAPSRDFPNYASGSWGPTASDELLARDGREWHSV